MKILEGLLDGKVKKEEVKKEDHEDVVVDLARYRVKNIQNFYFRDHPVDLNPNTPRYENYWYDFACDSVEGKWVLDEDTWYWMFPKLFFYCNYLKIEDKRKNPIFPHMRDIDRIIMRYITCVDGFSGFEDDPKYTCNRIVKKYNEEGLEDVEEKFLTKDCYIPGTDTLKEYVDAWEYLTSTYLIDDNRGIPLGRALWDNPVLNAAIFGTRGCGKSVSVFVGDFMHEWFFCGVKRKEDLGKTQRKRLFGMGSGDSAAIDRSLKLVASAMTQLPGSYTFPNTDGENIPKYMGPYYKNYNGSWGIGKKVEHIEKNSNGTVVHAGAMAQMRVITPDKTKIFAGDRFGRLYFEEAGFLPKLAEIHANQKDTLKINGERVGSEFILGTSGDLKSFRMVNQIINNPDTYDVFGIPNYWGNKDKKIGLFIPDYYTVRIYADENQNVDISRALSSILKHRAKYRKTASSMDYDKEIMYHPVEPKEMMRPSGSSVLPKAEAQEALNRLEAYDVFNTRSITGSLFYDNSSENGVRFKPDLDNELHPITTFETNNYPNLDGALILYENPMVNPPQDLYWVIYDPAAQSGEGTSLHSVIVYKFSFSGNENTLEDTIVAEWLGRLPTLEQNWERVIMIAKYFGAKIFPEYNTPGFLDWCNKRKLFNLLQPENMALKKEINPRGKSSAWRKGFRMDARTKGWALNKLRDWLLEVKDVDENGIPTKRVIDTIYSPRILWELIYFDPDSGNYDHISSLLGLMILQNALSSIKIPKVVDKYSEDEYFYSAAEEVEYVTPYTRRARASILNY